MKVALYIRVSTEEQANEGFSIEAQKRRLLAYAESQDWIVSGIFIDDGYSAKDTNRPQLQLLLSTLDQFDMLLVYKLDRLTRSTSDCDTILKLLDSKNVAFQSATESFETRTATGRLFIRLVADLAQWERENIAERVRFGMEQMVLEGKRPGAKLPYGYDKEGNLIDSEVEIIKDIRRMYMDGMGYKNIALYLNNNSKWRRGKEWRQSTVAYTLENPFYAGLIRFGSKTADGKYVNHWRSDRVECMFAESNYPAIFTREEYDEHIAFMKSKPNSGFSALKDYWFSGVLRCGRCGSAMFGRLTTARNRKSGTVRTQYYICSKKHDGRLCDMPTFRQVHVEHLLLTELRKLKIKEGDIETELQNAAKDLEQKQSEATKLKDQLRKIKERRKKWQYLFVENLLTSEELRERIRSDEEEEKEILRRLEETPPKPADAKAMQQFVDFWDVCDDSDKKQLVLKTFSKLTLHTPLTNVKGVKNKYFEATIDVEYQ